MLSWFGPPFSPIPGRPFRSGARKKASPAERSLIACPILGSLPGVEEPPTVPPRRPSKDSMIRYRINHCRPQFLVTFLVALAILFAGVRVPNVSRPHRPKPTQRIVHETQPKTISNHLKQHNDFFTVLPKIPVSGNSTSYHAVSHVVPPLYASSLFSPNPGRSPPAAVS